MSRLPFLMRPGLALGLAAALLAPGARAQLRVPASNGPGLDSHLFRPAVDSKGFFSVNGVETLGAGDLSFGLVTDYGRNLLRLEPGHGTDALVTNSFQGNFGFNIGLFNRLALGLQMPVNLMGGDAATGVGSGNDTYDAQQLNSQKIPFVAAHAKLRILKRDEGVGVALLVQGGSGLGDASRDLGGDAKTWVWPQIVLERGLGDYNMVRLGVNAGYRLGTASGTTRFDQLSGGKFESSKGLFTGGAALSVRAYGQLDIVAETYLTRQADGASASAVALSQEVVGGLKFFVERNSYLMMGGGVRLGKGYEAADQRAFLGFIFEPSIGDRDGDGIPDDEDKCPNEPEDKDGFQDEDGCPDLDNDGDGIPDSRDACPNEKETFNGYQDEDGCPDVDERDRDKDGIPDRLDKCPDEPEDKDGFEDEDGCPDLDDDKDGIPDLEDVCPRVPGVRSADPIRNGCPPSKPSDRDGDGIPDESDMCPDEPETFNGFKDEDGCPDSTGVVIENNSLMILQKVQFETGSAKIRKVSDALLDAVALALKGHPELQLVEVQGHADARGNARQNLKLTKDRAISVVKALTGRGVDASRLRPMGYGSYCPVDPGTSSESLEKNRRVEFKIVTASGQPTSVELGCAEAKANGVEPPATNP
jgi:outer membrane protein OmpA-like peptidoglycan-associated protein